MINLTGTFFREKYSDNSFPKVTIANIKIINKNLKEIGGQLGNVQIYLYNNIKVRSRLTDKKLKELVSGVNKEFKTKITDKKLLDIIKNMYKVTDKLYISSLRKRT